MTIKRSLLKPGVLTVIFALAPTICGAADMFQPAIDEAAATQLDALVQLRRDGKSEAAITQLNALLQQYPDYYYATYNLGVAYADAGKYPEAIAALHKAEDIKNNNNIVDYALKNTIGWVHLLNGDSAIAEKYFSEAIEDAGKLSGPARGRLYNNYAQLKISKGDYDGAETYLVKSTNEGNQLAKKTLQTLKSARE